jgi:hypothetical protein
MKHIKMSSEHVRNGNENVKFYRPIKEYGIEIALMVQLWLAYYKEVPQGADFAITFNIM